VRHAATCGAGGLLHNAATMQPYKQPQRSTTKPQYSHLHNTISWFRASSCPPSHPPAHC
jgi:hypothetical protein